MSKATQITQADILNTQTSGNANQSKENYSNTQLVSTKQIKNSPFYIIEYDNKFFIGIANKRISELMDSEDEAMQYYNENQWMMTVSLIMHIIDTTIAKKIICD